MTKVLRKVFLLLFMGLTACSSELGTSAPNPPTNPSQTTVSAVAALFTSNEDASVNKAVKIPAHALRRMLAAARERFEVGGTCGESDPACTCEGIEIGTDGGPENVVDNAMGTPGTYGSVDYGITLTDADFCRDATGVENTGTGPDGLGLFASFSMEWGCHRDVYC